MANVGLGTAGLLVPFALSLSVATGGDGNRLVHLDGCDPYWVGRDSARLVTPQWVGEDGVEAVVILAIDDLGDTRHYEWFLRPILERLKEIDGRAPVSIMTTRLDARDEQVQSWLAEGVQIEAHTLSHPCPLLCRSDFEAAKFDYEHCIDELSFVPGVRPVAYRMPCCDSMNSLSPRFYRRIFAGVTPGGRFLQADSSVFHLFTADDPRLPEEVVIDEDGLERFRKYVALGRPFANTIENHPYPYVIDRLCWEFPAAVPSDWQAQHRRGACQPETVRDLCYAIDATVALQGVFTLCFHPHGWIRREQVVEIVDHAHRTHGEKVLFLQFEEALARIERFLLGGHRLRAVDGQDAGVRLVDVDGDGFQDVIVADGDTQLTRRWDPANATWHQSDFPLPLVQRDGAGRVGETGARFGVLRDDGSASVLWRDESAGGLWHYQSDRWVEDPCGLTGLDVHGSPILTTRAHRDAGVRLRDLDGDGICELIVGGPGPSAVMQYERAEPRWQRLPFALPDGVSIVDERGRDRGLRFIDLDRDGHDDLVFSNDERSSVDRFVSMQEGWSDRRRSAIAAADSAVPQIVRDDGDNGAWFQQSALWLHNEHTASLPHHVQIVTFDELLTPLPEVAEPEASTEVSASPPTLESFELREGLRLELVACEPEVMDPVAFDWGPDGKLWVVEMADYPLGLDGAGEPGGRVRFLEDRDRDGRFETSTVFLDGLSFPSGVLAWKEGVLVTAAPEVLFAADTDGDGRADRRETLYSGFVEGNQQHRVNGLRRGLDGWVHLANGDSGGTVRSHRTGASIAIHGRDLRIRPEDGAVDASTGMTQFGRDRDDWGHWFGGNNSNPFWHFVLPDHALRRNPYLAVSHPRAEVSVTPGNARVYPVSAIAERFNDPHTAGRFTSACSPMVYRDTLLGRPFAGNLFVCEPVHNLVHREVRGSLGATFRSRRALGEETSEFLASRDPWFRPVMVRTGPDGALWIADMQRAVIEHPEWIPDEWEARLDLREGHERGRIYRVLPADRMQREVPPLASMEAAELVDVLDHPNGWVRDTAQALLVERANQEVVGPLETMALGQGPALGRLHALCTLDLLGRLEGRVLAELLAQDEESTGSVPAPLLRHVVRLCEPHLSDQPAWIDALCALSTSPDCGVLLQLALTLGECEDEEAGRALARIAFQPHADRFVIAAVHSSLVGPRLLGAVRETARGTADEGVRAKFLRASIEVATASQDQSALAHALRVVLELEPQAALVALDGLFAVLERTGRDFSALRQESSDDLRSSLDALERVFAAARSVVSDGEADLESRQRALRLLTQGPDARPRDLAVLASLLIPSTPLELQLAVTDRLRDAGDARVPPLLLEGWRSHSPSVRRRILDALLARKRWQVALVQALEEGEIGPRDVDTVRRQRLLELEDEGLRERANGIFAGSKPTDRTQLVGRMLGDLAGYAGDGERGRALFQQHCAACHARPDGSVGGPDLGALLDRSDESLLTAILDPNRAVEARFVRYHAWTKAGLQFSGLLARETGNDVTLMDDEGLEHVILRSELEELRSSSLSAMPEGFEEAMTTSEFADLLAFLREFRSLPKSFPGNEPRLLQYQLQSGALELHAADAEIHGTTLRYVESASCAAYWASSDDHLVWTVELSESATFDVELDYACADDCGGGRLDLLLGETRLGFDIEATGSWGNYRTVWVGRLSLKAGRHQLVARGVAPQPTYLIDLRSLRLTPRSEGGRER